MAEGALREGRACGVGCLTLGALDDADAAAAGFRGCRSNEAATAARSVSSKSSSITIFPSAGVGHISEAENWWVELWTDSAAWRVRLRTLGRA